MSEHLKANYFDVNGISWKTYQAVLDVDTAIYKKCKEQAEKKSKHTMNASQSGAFRSGQKKFQNQLRGCLAEEFAKLLIEQYCKNHDKNVSVIRYDNVRTDDFTSPEGEFDIKIINGDDLKYLESRSSVVHNRSFEDGLRQLNIVGPYSSIAKLSEKANDFYIQPLFRYKDYMKRDFYSHGLEDLIETDKVELHFVGGADYDLMFEKGVSRSLGQGASTTYKTIQILSGLLIDDFLKKITNT